MYAATIACALALSACGSAATATTGHASGSPTGVAAEQLASADHAPAERATIAADLTKLYPECQETTATLAVEITDAEQDLNRHAIAGNAAAVANALVRAAAGLAASAKPTVCNQLLSVYLNARGG